METTASLYIHIYIYIYVGGKKHTCSVVLMLQCLTKKQKGGGKGKSSVGSKEICVCCHESLKC